MSNLIGNFQPASISEVPGISHNTHIVGKGIVEWTIIDYWNVVRFIHPTVYYVPGASIRIFSLQTYFQENHSKDYCVIKLSKATLDLPYCGKLESTYNKVEYLALILTSDLTIAGLHFQDAAVYSKWTPLQYILIHH